MFTLAQLKDRGWSAGLIKQLLGAPDETSRNPVFRSKAPMKLWERGRVEVAESHADFAAHQTKRAALAERSRSVANRKRQLLLAKIDATDVHVKLWPLGAIYRAAIADWERMGTERGDYGRVHACPLSSGPRG